MTVRPRQRTRPAAAQTAATAPDRRASRWPRWPFAAIAAAGIGAYVNAPGHPFVFDDASTIVANPTIRSLASSVWGGPVQGATAGRPLPNITFALNYLSGGLAPWGYQVVNLAIHVACALLLFALLRRMLRLPLSATMTDAQATGIAVAVALLWVVHPLNSEVINYATQRTEALMALAFLATLYCGVRALSGEQPRRWQIGAVAACAAGMTCKESMVTAPLVMLVLDAMFTRTRLPDVLRRRAPFYAALFATWIVLALLVVEGPRWRSAGFSSGVSPWTYLLDQGPMIARYLRLVFVPTGLVLDYGEPATRTLADVWPSAALVVLLLAATVAAWRTAPIAAFFGVWYFLTLAPTSSILPIATEVGAERRMYLPLMAVLAVLTWAAAQGLKRLEVSARQTAARGLVALLCVVLAGLTLARNREYKTGLGLWQTVVERWPTGRGHYNLGTELKAAGRRADAIAEYRRAAPDTPEAHYALGFELQADGRYDEAIEHYRTFIGLKPEDIGVLRAYHQIGRSLLAQGKRDEALAAFRDVLTRKADEPDALAGLADTLLALERLPEAVAAYRQYLRVMPNRTDAMMNLGVALVKMDRDGDAGEVFARIVQLEPGNVAAHVNLAYAMANTGKYRESLQEFRRAADLEKDPAGRAEIEAAIATLLGSH